MRWGLLVLLLCGLAGCDDMADQPKRDAYAIAAVGPGPVPADTVPFGALPQAPPATTPALLERGHAQYQIFCAPCHAANGAGDGIVTRYGFPVAPALTSERLRTVPPRRVFDVISQGDGVMYGLAASLAPRDRWAIVAYLGTLPRSQGAP